MTHDDITIGLAVTLLGALVVNTWRGSALATRLGLTVDRLEKKEEKVDDRLKAVDKIPAIETRQDSHETAIRENMRHTRNHGLTLAAHEERFTHVERQIGSLKGLRTPWQRPPSKPDIDPEEE
jgi:hypothetical protein